MLRTMSFLCATVWTTGLSGVPCARRNGISVSSHTHMHSWGIPV
jgi:hypothetical protein